MIENIDIWRQAKLLVDRHGDEAPMHAAMRADELLADGDIDGQRIGDSCADGTTARCTERRSRGSFLAEIVCGQRRAAYR